MNKLPKEKRDRILMILGGALAGAVLIYYFLITEQNAKLEKVQELIRDVAYKTSQAEMRIKRAPDTKSGLEEIGRKLAAAESQMLPSSQIDGNLWLFNTLTDFIRTNQSGARYDVTTTGLDPKPQVDKKFLSLPRFAYGAAAYTWRAEAFFHEFGRFLADFENSFPFIAVQDLQIYPLATPGASPGSGFQAQDVTLKQQFSF